MFEVAFTVATLIIRTCLRKYSSDISMGNMNNPGEISSAIGAVAQRLKQRHRNDWFHSQLDNLFSHLDLSSATHFWDRDQEDLANLVVLSRPFLWDVSWNPQFNLAAMSVVRVNEIISVDFRATPGAGGPLGFNVVGDLAVRVHVSNGDGGLVWVGGNKDEAQRLVAFTHSVLGAIS